MDEVMQNTRWNILALLSRTHSSATELAKKSHASVPNVSQQLKLLQAYDLIEQGKTERGAVGKPRQQYRLKRPIASLAIVTHGFAEKRFFHPSVHQIMLLRALLLQKADDELFLLKVLFDHEELLHRCSVAFLRSSSDEFEVLLLTEDVEHVRKQYSKIAIDFLGKKRTWIAWTHSIEEVTQGISHSDQYFTGMVRACHIIHDPEQRFSKIGEGGVK